MNPRNFFAELKRRNVYNVAVAYAVVGWLVMQIAATVVPALHLPDEITSWQKQRTGQRPFFFPARDETPIRSIGYWIEHPDEGKPVKVGVTRVEVSDSMLAHEHGSVGVVQNVAAKMRQLSDDLGEDHRVPRGWQEQTGTGRIQHYFEEAPARRNRPRISQSGGVCANSQEFITNSPRKIPRRSFLAAEVDSSSASLVELGVLVGRIDQDVGVDHDHLPASLHRFVKRVAIGNIHQVPSSTKTRQRRQLCFRSIAPGLEQEPQRRFDQFRHGAALPDRLPPQTGYHRIIDVKGRLRMASHIEDIPRCQ